MSGLIRFIFVAIFLSIYAVGAYDVITDDHRYTSKDVAAATFIPPYTLWLGSSKIYRLISINSADRDMEKRCLDTSETLGVPRKSRLRFCDCLLKSKDINSCKSKIYNE